jgi:ABC-type branched-subunit amino acid transport system substrate-binding protein
VNRLCSGFVAVVVSVGLAACGSQLDPQTVAAVNQDGSSGAEAGTGSVPGAADPGGGDSGVDTGPGDTTVPGADEGTADGAGPGVGAGPGGGTDGGGRGGSDPTGGAKVGDCSGLKNQTGITDKTITLANISDISGPSPGLFESSQLAIRAYVEFFNSHSDICGRKLEVLNLDSRTESGADQQAYVKACEQAFAAVGSMSGFDSGGASTAESCGLPDLRAASVTPERQGCSTCFGMYAVKTNLITDAYAKWFMSKYPEATDNVGLLYINAGAAVPNAKSQAAAWQKMGWDIKYMQGMDISEFNFAPYVQQLKEKGIKTVAFIGPYQNTVKLQEAMRQQGYKPDVFLQDSTLYDQRYLEQAGGLAEGAFVYSTNDLFENTANKEMQTYLSWLQQAKPGADPHPFGLYAWSAARLFVEKAIALGGKLNRKKMVDAVARTNDWTANGLHTAQAVGTGQSPRCAMVIQYRGGKWRKVSPGSYLCGKLVDSGIGG